MRLSSLLSRASLVLALAGSASAQSNWIDWVDETSTRIVGDPSVTTSDDQEKDMFAADFDRDGDDDLVVARKVPFSTPGGRVNVLLMNEGGVLTDRTAQFIPSFATPDDARDILAFDANGDDWLDLVIATTFGQQPRLWINQGESGGLWRGFVEDTSWFSPLFNPGPKFCAVYDGDVDNDGDKDLFFSDYDSPLDDRLLINDGTGKFTDETDNLMSSAASDSIFGTGSFICDFNKDGWKDILKSAGAFEPVKLVINDGTGHFNQVQVFDTTAAYMVRAADFNNDNRIDFYVVDDGQDYIYINLSTAADGTINTKKVFVNNSDKTLGFGGNVHEADLDGDGYIDLGVADVDVDIPGCARRFAALRNRNGMPAAKDGFLDPNNSMTLRWNSQGVHDLAFLDIDGDGLKDMVQGRCVGLRVWIMQPFRKIFGTPFCEAGVNTEGKQARIHGYGSTSISANNFRIVVEGAARGQFGLFFYGAGQQQVPFGDGFLCVSGQLFRLTPAIGIGGSHGLAPYDVDFNAPPANGGAGQITSGSTWNFQFWYRDPGGQTANSNSSDATAITFTP